MKTNLSSRSAWVISSSNAYVISQMDQKVQVVAVKCLLDISKHGLRNCLSLWAD